MSPVCPGVLFLAAILSSAEPPALPQPPPVPSVRVQSGTPIYLRLSEELRTRSVRPGVTVNATVSVPLTIDGCVVIPKGAPAEILVSESRAASVGGQPDRLALRAYRVRDRLGNWIPLDGEYAMSGEDRNLESLGAAATVSCLFLTMKGDPVVLGAGTGWVAFISAQQSYSACK